MTSAIGRGEGSEIGQNCRRIVLKICRLGGGGCQKSGKIADVVYGWSLIQNYLVTKAHSQSFKLHC